jgi:hypothetical protein
MLCLVYENFQPFISKFMHYRSKKFCVSKQPTTDGVRPYGLVCPGYRQTLSPTTSLSFLVDVASYTRRQDLRMRTDL